MGIQKLSFVATHQEAIEKQISENPEIAAFKLSTGDLRKLIVTGKVYLNSKRCQNPRELTKKPGYIDVYIDDELVKKRARLARIPQLKILYDDEAIVCYDKPAGLPTQPTLDRNRPNAYDIAKQDHPYLGLHHRLDVDTSGVLLFTKHQKYNKAIADEFKEHRCTKIYVALVHGRIARETGHLETFLDQVGKSGKQTKFGSVRSGGKKAITDFTTLKCSDKYSLVEVKIATGRTHQIRVHMSEMKHPVVGDTLYGSPVEEFNRRGRFLLHAHSLSIRHPISNNIVRIESPIPPEFRL